MAEPPVVVDAVSHFYGSGTLRRQILHAVSAEIVAGEIVILTGPSGSLMGALRATQEGSLRVFGRELRDASVTALMEVRRQIGFIFQFHNLLRALTAVENVVMGLQKHLGLPKQEAYVRAREMLASVGLEKHTHQHPDQLSGGQKQRVAIARALAARPQIVLADEPTGSLDRDSGREVVSRLHDLAKQDGAAVVLVTHDNRILDVADRIIHLEEGRLSTFTEAVRSSTQRLLATLTRSSRTPEVIAQVAGMPPARFARFLEDLTKEARELLDVMTLGTNEAFETMLAQMLEVLTLKVGQLLDADRVSLLLGDDARGELYSLVAQNEIGPPLEIRIPVSTGVAGHVYRTGEVLNVPDAYASPLFNRDVDQQTGYRTASLLCVPIKDADGRSFAVMTLLNKKAQPAFDDADDRAAQDLATQLGIVLRTWHQAHHTRAALRN